MSHWLSQVIQQGELSSDWLAPVRHAALEQLKQQGWPSRRAEAWRFTPLTAIANRDALTASSAITETTPGTDSLPLIPDLDAIELVFAHGQLLTDLSTVDLPAGLTMTSFSDASPSQQQSIVSLLGKIKPSQHLFGLVNDVICQQGVFIDIADGAEITTPVKITQLASDDQDQHFRVLVNLGQGAKASIIEHGQGSQASVNTCFSEYRLQPNSYLEHYRFALFTEQAMHLGGCHFELHEKAELNSTIVGYGSQLSRLDVDVNYAGEFAHAQVNAVYLLAPNELFDLHSTIEHAVPNCTTEENARGIVGDKARAVFSGRIHIHPDAQKTLAELNNRNLLLSRRAVVNTKPELEIYADDVRCAHGATVAEIDEKSLYYLLTRGISRSQALVMLNFGFIQELVNQIPNQAISSWLAPLLRDKFAAMEVK
jgi:Fe-S cluster assembly protein SufD